MSYGCYYSLFEFGQIGLDYVATVQDINKLAYNLIHNLGDIYDNVDTLYSLYSQPRVWDIVWWRTSMRLIGNTIN